MRQIDLQSMVDEARFSSFHWVVLIWCGLAIVFDGHDLRLGYHWHGIEREGIEGLSGGEFGLSQMPFGPPPIPFGDLMLGERGQEPGSRPAFPVGARSKVAPHMLDCWQAQLVQHQAEPLGIDHRGCAHAASPHPIRLS